MKVSFTTNDNIKIVGDLNQPNGAAKAILLLHMMPSTKESWSAFAEKLNNNGWATLAIDERGHGESLGGPYGYKSFTPAQQQAKIYDVEAAARWVKDRGLRMEATVGASIGANLALVYQAKHSEIISTIPISPGLNYLGVDALAAVGKLKPPHRVYFVASANDERVPNAVEMARELYANCLVADKRIYISKSAKHGTDIFDVEPDLQNQLIAWLSKN